MGRLPRLRLGGGPWGGYPGYGWGGGPWGGGPWGGGPWGGGPWGGGPWGGDYGYGGYGGYARRPQRHGAELLRRRRRWLVTANRRTARARKALAVAA